MGEKLMKIFGFIFARGGSKGVPGKNIRPLAGLPLLAHAINAGQQSGLLDRIIVSTDDEKIAEVAREYGAEVPFMRPAELAGDASPEWLAWQHAITEVGGPDVFDLFVSLPATSPLRSAEDVINCISLFQIEDCDMVVTCREAGRHPSFNMIKMDADGVASLVMPLDTAVTRRQDAPVVYDMTTVAYVARPEFIMNHGGTFEGKVRAVVIPDERALDIDTELDFEFAEFLMTKRVGL